MFRININAGITAPEFIDSLNKNYKTLFEPQYFILTDSRASQAIPSSVWTRVLFDTVAINRGGSTLDSAKNRAVFDLATVPDSSGLWNAVYTVCWDNTAVGLGRHTRKIRNVQTSNLTPIVFVAGTQDQLFDPAAGATGEAAKSFQQCYMQPGYSNEKWSIHHMYLEVFQNSGMTINLVRDGMQAPNMQFVKLDGF